MFMSVLDKSELEVFPELAGARVLITGLTSDIGVDVARAFADHKARLAIQSPEQSPAMVELIALLGETASELALFNEPMTAADDIVRFVQRAAQDLGGLDVVVNLTRFDASTIPGHADPAQIEARLAAVLEPLHLATKVAANRMRLTWCEGSILNVVTCASSRPHPAADILRAMVQQMTRGEAQEWSEDAIRVNAIAPPSTAQSLTQPGVTASDADIAHIALQLASKRGRKISGHVLEAEGTAARRCSA